MSDAWDPWAGQRAAELIEQVDRRHPADGVLRSGLRRLGAGDAGRARFLARAVFAFFRWRGWLESAEVTPRALRQTWELQCQYQSQPKSITDEALRTKSVPSWVERELRERIAWLRAIQREPQIWLRALRGQGASLSDRWKDISRPFASPLPDCLAYHGNEDLYRSADFQSGRFELQDIHSQMVGHLCDPAPGETWWDACAGSGGKLLHLSGLMGNRGLIWATDRSSRRLAELKRRAARAGAHNYRMAHWTRPFQSPLRTRFDGILLDAPCSGVGTWDRNPDGRWTTQAEDVDELAGIQSRLLESVAPQVKNGGKLIYAACSLTRAETEGVAACFENAHADFERLVWSHPALDSLGAEAKPGRCWLWPSDYGGVGMFLAGWRRVPH